MTGTLARKYNKKLHATIVDAIRKGNTKTTAFKLTGMHPDSIFDWLALARANPGKYPEYEQLAADIVQAQAEFEAEKVSQVKTAADTGTWQAAAWFLERKNPGEWGRYDRVEQVGEQAPRQQINVLILEDGDARKASRELLNRLAAGRSDITLGPGAVRKSAEVEE